MNSLQKLQDLKTPLAFYNIQKLNCCSKIDISKTAWINACTTGGSLKTVLHPGNFLATVEYKEWITLEIFGIWWCQVNTKGICSDFSLFIF